MFLQRLMRPGPARQAGQRLYAAVVEAARTPAIYAELGAPDTPDGRFEIYTLFVLLLLERLRALGAPAKAVSQEVFDAYLGGLDHGLRELAVGDLSVGKSMRKLGEAFYGRGKAWNMAAAELPDRAAMEELVRRTVFAGSPAAAPGPIVERLLQVRAALAACGSDALLRGEAALRP
jgi:cytochrome b pre-mRNA-processing protein 3